MVVDKEQPAATPTPMDTNRRWRNLVAMAFATIVDTTEGGAINNLFPLIRQSLGLSLASLGTFILINRFARMIFGPLWAILADRFGRKNVLVFVTGIWGIWTVLAGFSQNYWQLLILYSVGVVGTVASEPIINALLSDLYPPNERGRAFGTVKIVAGIAIVVFLPVVGILSSMANGWRLGFFLLGGMSILSGLFISLWVYDPRTDNQESGVPTAENKDNFRLSDVPKLLQIPTIWLMSGSLILMTSLLIFAYAVTVLVEVNGFSTATSNLIFATFAFGFAISSYLGGVWGDLFEQIRPKYGRIIFLQIYLVLYAIVSYLAVQIDWVGGRTPFFVVWFVFGFVAGLGFPGAILPMISTIVRPEFRSTAFGFLLGLVQGAMAAGLAYLAGRLGDVYGLRVSLFWLVTFPYALHVFFAFLYYRYYPQDILPAEEST